MSAASKDRFRSLADFVVRYDLIGTLREARADFSPELGSQRLLKQSEISARFRKRPRRTGSGS
jgi:hypothetical protein